MRTQPAGRVVRQKKLNRSTHQQVLREDQIESAEYDSLQGQHKVETGVEKAEENEYHLQAALAATTSAGDKDAPNEIPAPPAEEGADIDYDALYSRKFDKPATYIRFSQTVEECTGCQYNMSTEDDVFLKEYNKKKSGASQLSEDDFEKLMDLFEETAETQAPYASVDNTVVSFDAMKEAMKERGDEKVPDHAKEIYEYWKTRKQACGNHGLQPSLKFETHQDNDEGDPYVCFRRREVRITRKTRARDTQITEKLRKLRKELEDARLLTRMATEREIAKKNLLHCERSVFESRTELKNLKVKMGIKNDDDDLINQKPQKRKASDLQVLQRPPSQLRMPNRPDGRPIDTDLILLSDQLAQKENMLQRELEEKSAQHTKWNENYIDCTREPLLPVEAQGSSTSFRPATAQYQYLLTPPSSVTSESFDQSSPIQHEKADAVTVRYGSPPPEDEHRGQPAYRRRIGRGGRLWIDRRGMSTASKSVDEKMSDRWKYDQDDDDDGQPVYEVDPYDTKCLKFRSTIPLSLHLYPDPHRQRVFHKSTGGNGGSPVNNKAIGPPAVQPTNQPNS
ncbi:Enhancer of polycomb 1 protein [Rutstroemia sp. NJR-2017a BBW]|nr:Enhancer of polycomb 1 protein [Rutstroemia sp. NJR-2017a BBW]